MTPARTEFKVVTRGARRTPWLGLALTLVALAGVVAAANLTVTQRADTSSVYAERFNVGQEFAVEASGFFPTSATRAALGTSGAPVELATGTPEARTLLTVDHWVYSVTLKESSADAVKSGTFTIELFVDEALKGTLVVAQGTRDAANVEAVRARFDIGTTFSTSSLYYVVVKPVIETGPSESYVLRSDPAGTFKWRGVGAPHDGVENPALTVAAGTTLKLTARNADGERHNIGIRDGANVVQNPPGWSGDILATGDEAAVSWLATAGTWKYVCQYHPNTMVGTITVS